MLYPFRTSILSVALALTGGVSAALAQCPSAIGDHPVSASPTRPVITDSADVIQTGVVEMESGWASSWPGGATRQDSFGALFKMGLLCNFEFRISTNAFQSQINPDGSSLSGVGDVWFTGQYRLIAQHKSVPSVSVIYGIKQATASVSKGLGSGQTDNLFAVAVGQPWGKTLWSFEDKLILSGRPNDSGYDRNSEISLNLARPISRKFALIGEIYGDTQKNAVTAGFASNLWAVQYNASSKLIFDGGVDVGLTSGAPHKRVFVGMSYAFGDLYRSLRHPLPH
jgi:hypothetical protein